MATNYLGRDSLINKKQTLMKLTKNQEKGLEGEIAVGDLLSKYLPKDTYIISHPIIGKYDPDFLIISPRYGFRMIEVKHWEIKPIKTASPNGSLEIMGDIQNPLDQVRKHIEDLNAYLLSSYPEINNPYQLIGCAVVHFGFSKNDFTTKFPPDRWNHTMTQHYYNCHIFKDQLNQNIDMLLEYSTKYPGCYPKLSNEMIEVIANKLSISDKYASEIEIETNLKFDKITNELAEKVENLEKNNAKPPEPKMKMNKFILALAGILLTLLSVFIFNGNIFTKPVNGFSTTQPNGVEQQGQKIKGNINAKGEKIYHVPGGKYYEVTTPEEWFLTEKDAQVAGFRKSQS
ncbi:nuclease-related domain-containing protein [Desulfosporosinus shakirovi]|uniref:nuclease-related domain-containing protein n=1 Tax=Desulfosporosinus shakirovi TaxID=2885154 RepID=UPI001E64E3D5|nr:nuclease-related domain-containing protein [Desulfosporosinus sp. SRJS8]MCB8817396.1 NERD domain-containing protein [Desulfosporosinus sp. SRJS8]